MSKTTVRFEVMAKPIPQPRPRARVFQSPGKAPTAQVYAAPKKHPVNLWKSQIVDAWRLAMTFQGFRFTGPISVDLVFVMPRPSNLVWKTKPMPRTPDTRTNGDVDNLAKAVLDALNGKAYDDDRQVVRLEVTRWMAGGGLVNGQPVPEKPHAIIDLRPFDPIPPAAEVLDVEAALPF